MYWLVPMFVLVTFSANFWLLRNSPDKGVIGDLFGASNAIFTGLALCAAAIAVHLQSTELAETRAELAKAALAQQEAAILQKEILELQRLNAIVSIKLQKAQIEATLAEIGNVTTVWFDKEIEELTESILGKRAGSAA
ncbi:UNVERIFIED_ORG: integral membrane sensor domain MASE1 [Xanthomonas campestris]